MSPSPEAAMMIEALRGSKVRPDQPIDEQRAGFDALGVNLPLADGVEVVPVAAGGVPSEWLVADPDGPMVVHLHGGGFVIGSCSSHRPFASRLAAAVGGRVLVPDYRRAPEHPFPAPDDDSCAAYRFAVDAAGGGGVAVTGDSAGGALALSLLRRSSDEGLPAPTCIGVVSPLVDLTLSSGSMEAKAAVEAVLSRELLTFWNAQYAGDVPLDDPRIDRRAVDLTGAPPLLVLVGSEEVLLDDARELVDRARGSAVDAELDVWEGLFHIWTVFAPLLPEAEQGIARLGEFVRRHTA